MDEDRMPPPGFRLVLAWLVHPVTLIAVVLLAVNDHVLKDAYPSLLTGKLSDAAGLLVTPPVLALVLTPLLARRSPNVPATTAILVTGAGFTAAKLPPAGAALASAAWSAVTGPSVIRADPTDLTMLSALALAWWTWTRARRRPVTWAAVRRFGTLVALPAATLALVATPAPYYPDAVAVTSWHGLVVVGDANAYHQDREPERWRVSGDGRNWRAMTEAEQAEFDRVRDTLPLTAQQGCVPAQPSRCYRLVPGHMRVEETSDGGTTWSTSWQVPDDRRGYLARHYEGVRDVETDLSSQALVVHPVPGGHVVIVANGRDGYAHRDVSGRWVRTGFDASDDPPPLAGDSRVLAAELAAAFLVGLLVLGLGGWAAGTARGLAGGFGGLLLLGASIAFVGAAGLNSVDLLLFGAWFVLLVGALMMLIGIVAVAVIAVGRRVRWRRLLLVPLIAAGTTAGWAVSFVGWGSGVYGYRAAALTAVLIAVTGVVLSVSAGRAAQPPDGERLTEPPYPPPVPVPPTSSTPDLS